MMPAAADGSVQSRLEQNRMRRRSSPMQKIAQNQVDAETSQITLGYLSTDDSDV